MKNCFADIAVTVGCVVGIGFISGKEAQTFWSDRQSVALFAVAFALSTYLLREFCRKNNCNNLEKFCCCALPKGHVLLQISLLLANFICIVTMLAGVNDCLCTLLNTVKTPIFAIISATMCVIVLCKSGKSVKLVNILALIVVVILVICVKLSNIGVHADKHTTLILPLCYCAFCLATSLGVTTAMGAESSRKQNAVVSVGSALIIAVLMWLIQTSCDYNQPLPALGKLYGISIWLAVIAGVLATLTGIVANAIPLLQATSDLLDDKVVQCVVLFVTAVAFSLFGFDFVLTVGYLAVSVIGFAIMISVTRQSAKTKLCKLQKEP